MSVYKESNNKNWYFSVRYTDIQGNKKQKLKRGFKTRRAALAAEHEFIGSLNNGVYNSVNWTISDLIDIYIEDKKKIVKPNTLKGIVGSLNGRVRFFIGNVALKNLTNAHIVALHESLFNPPKDSKYKPLQLSSAKELHSVFMAMIKYAEKHYDIPKMHHKFSPPKYAEIKKPNQMKCYTHKQIYSFLDQIPEEHQLLKDILEVLYLTGMRVSELLALTYSAIDFQKKKISIYQNAVYGINKDTGKYESSISTPKTSSSIRMISIPKQVIEIFDRYLEADQVYKNFSDEWFIFSDEKINPILYSNLLYKKKGILLKLGLPNINFHDLRHSHASLLINGGAEPLMVQQRLGHASVTTTLEIYAHLFPEKEDEILSFLNRL